MRGAGASERLAAFLGAVWWILLPAFAVLVGVLSLERTCADPYRLVPGVMSKPITAWSISLLYISAHAWLLAVYLHASAHASSLWPSLEQMRSVWGHGWLKIAVMLATLAVEYCPLSLWRAIGSTVPSVCRLS